MSNLLHTPLWPNQQWLTVVGPVELDAAHPLAQNLVAYWLFREGVGITSSNLVSANRAFATVTTSPQPWRFGTGILINRPLGGDVWMSEARVAAFEGAGNATFMAEVIPWGAPEPWGGILYARDGGTVTGLAVNGSLNVYTMWNGSGWSTESGLGFPNLGTRYVIGATQSYNPEVFVNGRVSVAAQAYATTSGVNRWCFGQDDYAYGRVWNGSIQWSAIWTRRLSIAEMEAIYDNPYQFVKSVKRRIYMSVAPTAAPSTFPALTVAI